MIDELKMIRVSNKKKILKIAPPKVSEMVHLILALF